MALEMDFPQLIIFLRDANNRKKFYELAQSESVAICELLSDTQRVMELARTDASAIALIARLQPKLLLSKFKDVSDLLSLSKIANDALYYMVNSDSSSVISLFKKPAELVEFAIYNKTAFSVLLSHENKKIKELFNGSDVPEDLMQQCKNTDLYIYKNFLLILEIVQLENKNRLEDADTIEESTRQKSHLDQVGLFKKQETNNNQPGAETKKTAPEFN